MAEGLPSKQSECTRDWVKAQLGLLIAAEESRLDALDCPACSQPRVSVWFTDPSPVEYRVWFLGESCNYELRAQTIARPAFFSEGRIHYTKKLYDRSLIAKRRVFKAGDALDETE